MNKIDFYKSQKIVLIMPAFNEAERIEPILSFISIQFKNVIVIDDGSTDQTAEIIQKYPVINLRNEQNKGAGFSTRIGCDYAINKLSADIIVTIDADGQHNPRNIFTLLNYLIDNKLQIVFGLRKRIEMPLENKLGGYILSKFSSFLFQVYLEDVLTGFKVFKSEIYPCIRWESNKYEFGSEFAFKIYKNKIKYGEVKVDTIYNGKEGGMKKIDGIKSLVKMIYWRFFS